MVSAHGTSPVYRTSGDRRTLVVHTGGIGDFLLFCPSLMRIREDGPVVLAGHRDRLNLAVIAGIAEDAHDLDDIAFHSVFTEPNDRLRTFLRRFDRVMVWMNDDGAICDRLKACGVAEVLVFPGLPPEDWRRHACEYYAKQLGLGPLSPLRLPIAPGEVSHDVVIHPGSGGARKNWPFDQFLGLAQRLTGAGRTVEWLKGPAEEDFQLPAEAQILEPPAVVSLARELAGTKTYIGNDSGVTHLAAACGCKTVAIFGPTDPAVWAPRGDNVLVVRGEPWPGVMNAIDAMDRMDNVR